MNNKIIRTFIFIVIGLVAMPAIADESYSGFIDNYPELKADADRPGSSKYEKTGFNPASYGKVMLSPITIFMHPKSDYQGLDAGHVSSLSTGFIDILTEELEPEIAVVDQPGKGVLVARIAITNLKAKKKKRGLLSFTPIGLAVTAAQGSAGRNLKLKDAGLEIELLDGVTGEQLAVLIDKQALADEEGNTEQSWSGIETTLAFYAKRFKERLESGK